MHQIRFNNIAPKYQICTVFPINIAHYLLAVFQSKVWKFNEVIIYPNVNRIYLSKTISNFTSWARLTLAIFELFINSAILQIFSPI